MLYISNALQNKEVLKKLVFDCYDDNRINLFDFENPGTKRCEDISL